MPSSGIAKQIIAKNLYMTIASATKNGRPWISPVYYSFDKNYRFYWISDKNSVHSKLINKNPDVSIVIFDSSQKEKFNAVYMNGKAKEIGFKEVKRAVTIIYSRKMKTHNKMRTKNYMDFQGKSPKRIYKFAPSGVWILKPLRKLKGHGTNFKIKVTLKK